ncbi:hypothetical protein ACFX13_047974 [Malus domestica]|uniref:BHLH domain-containing protein n=1 Tax=Malus domestica TaxID=3750 RepID=A0A498J5U8_MALDO|nr:putative transcription factor bHLH086 [Malus sylvestris]RXH90566.1 hypothetical protein DVH24_035330 [Malus domestica]
MALAKDIRISTPHDSCTHESLQVSDLSDGFVFRATSNYQPDHLINFKSGYYNSGESLLSFDKNKQSSQSIYLNGSTSKDDCDSDLYHGSYSQWNQMAGIGDPRLSGDFSCLQTASNYSSSIPNTSKEDHGDHEAYAWLHSEASDSFQEPDEQKAGFHKRPITGESMQPSKKQCTGSTKKPKPKSSTSPSKDPQSIAAKNRRERISERLKILQELVPNGCKVDLVTMLEKAINYVKFLQLQVKVLATDEFWPVQGGKAPDISQVKEAIEAILSSSQRDTSSSSK